MDSCEQITFLQVPPHVTALFGIVVNRLSLTLFFDVLCYYLSCEQVLVLIELCFLCSVRINVDVM